LSLRKVWRLENSALWRKYDTERTNIKDVRKKRMANMPQVNIRPSLTQATQALPSAPCKEINEVFLLHGTKPETVWCLGHKQRAAGKPQA
jgi:hypothetical protein